MKQDVDYLKSRFKRGDKPTEQDFIDLFDSMLHKNQLNLDFYPCIMQVEKGLKDGDTFIIERRFEIISIYVNNNTLLSGNISIGSAVGLSDIVAVMTLPENGKPKRMNYIFNSNFPDIHNRTMFVNIESLAKVKLQILTRKLFE